MILKYAILGAVAGLLSTIVDDTAAQIAVFAAGAAGAGYLWKHIVWPFIQILHHALTAWRIWEGMPDWCAGVDHRLQSLEAKVSATHEPVEAIARELDIPHRAPNPPGPPPI